MYLVTKETMYIELYDKNHDSQVMQAMCVDTALLRGPQHLESQALESLTTLWVKVTRFEAPGGPAGESHVFSVGKSRSGGFHSHGGSQKRMV